MRLPRTLIAVMSATLLAGSSRGLSPTELALGTRGGANATAAVSVASPPSLVVTVTTLKPLSPQADGAAASKARGRVSQVLRTGR